MRMMPETDAEENSKYFLSLKYSCTVVIGKTVLFLGGQYEEHQISQLNPLGLIRIGTLPFQHDKGTCLVTGSQLFLGFGSTNTNRCWSR